ncbi:MAG: DUF4159 domain-containing protein [Rhizobiaceae bacterium]
MNFLPIAFAQPLVLYGLIALPVIWWLLRLTPPRPQIEVFPPLRILARVLKTEETPHQSPWWLTLLRLMLAALVILALADPVFKPAERLRAGGSALAIVMDNSWPTARDWDRRVATAERLIDGAGGDGVPVVLAFTAEGANSEVGPFDADAARDRLRAAQPRPVPADRQAIYARVAQTLESLPGAAVAVLSDGLAGAGDEAAFAGLLSGDVGELVWIAPETMDAVGLTAADNEPEAMVVTAIRAAGDPAPRQLTVAALDDKGRRIAEASATFGAAAGEARAELRVPFELRNDFNAIVVDGENLAASVRVLDENARRRRVGLISASEADQAQPLLSPLYYIRKALQPFADLVEPETHDLVEAIPELIDSRPAIIVMADVGIIPETARARLIEWVEGGGTLLRFAGPRLAAAGNDEDLLPVKLRLGERALGGTLSWTEPQPVAEFPQQGPFFDLAPPREVVVRRQVLAEPTPDIVERTWAGLADGTPLVTGASRGDGTLVLFHVPPEATWSNLPISGTFVDMLRRVVQFSRNQGRIERSADGKPAALPPFRMVSAEGGLVPPPPEAEPLVFAGAGQPPVTLANPPGLYGTGEGVVAHNLLAADAVFEPIAIPQAAMPVTEMRYAFDEQRDLKGSLVMAALALLALDTLAVFWIGGVFNRRARLRAAGGAAMLAAVAILAAMTYAPPVMAQETTDAKSGDLEAIEAISRTRIAYVLTGDTAIDSISRAGIAGLNRFLIEKTALEPGDPAGVDIAVDELAFYPLIYWPVDPAAPMPSDAAIARIDAYMQQGGTVLFDTRDQYASGFGAAGATPATLRLREILANLNVPPLEPVPQDHVLTKSFYILRQFPGRYADAPLWVEASLEAENSENRPVRTGDGVSPIMITAADFAGAWAIDEAGRPMFPTVPANPMQRVYALRSGVNIMMYMLTGNYKSDQVHLPILLERLGQ